MVARAGAEASQGPGPGSLHSALGTGADGLSINTSQRY